jgi:3D (Asp-Asp-Asp) domain-containing protein
MNKSISLFKAKTPSISLIIALFLISLILSKSPVIGIKAQSMEDSEATKDLYIIQENSLASISSPSLSILYPSLGYKESEVKGKMQVMITAYTSTPEQTDSTPFITASNQTVRDGIVANNLLPFGTKIKIPALFGDKIFEVQDRMHSRKPNSQIDIWFENYAEAKQFGVKQSYIEIIED